MNDLKTQLIELIDKLDPPNEKIKRQIEQLKIDFISNVMREYAELKFYYVTREEQIELFDNFISELNKKIERLIIDVVEHSVDVTEIENLIDTKNTLQKQWSKCSNDISILVSVL